MQNNNNKTDKQANQNQTCFLLNANEELELWEFGKIALL